jgi:hypothetical protein
VFLSFLLVRLTKTEVGLAQQGLLFTFDADGLNCRLQVNAGCRSVQVGINCRLQVSAGQCRSVQLCKLFVNEEQHNNTFRFVNYKLQPLSILVIVTKS